jgi:hypothetical protein
MQVSPYVDSCDTTTPLWDIPGGQWRRKLPCQWTRLLARCAIVYRFIGCDQWLRGIVQATGDKAGREVGRWSLKIFVSHVQPQQRRILMLRLSGRQPLSSVTLTLSNRLMKVAMVTGMAVMLRLKQTWPSTH